MNTNAKEIWFTTTKSGRRMAWYFSHAAFRSFRIPLAEAELAIATGQATEVTKPEWVGR
ncbi:hypothetical protein [Gordonia tangerina]|uniref:Uncharacterized protein n=1 Tax=Gordonia tangerina TaxID=2911060 RepID=A0ABS9DQ35_9ACTN|nr:hypothetical protein [Gordonia tangerina]MCF3939918.1 hypothetical protein [Gordonia tangerina]